MAKISPIAAKYIVHSKIIISGIVDRPDVIGAIFGQTEGFYGILVSFLMEWRHFES